jgi:hypothetical protein
LREDSHAAFLIAHIEIACTLLELAEKESDQREIHRYRAAAWKAHDAVIHPLMLLNLEPHERAHVEQKLRVFQELLTHTMNPDDTEGLPVGRVN